MFVISEIELPKGKDPAAFAEFVREKWMPTVHMGPTRVGQVQGLKLLQQAGAAETDGEDDAGGHRFLLLVGWDGLPPGNGRRWIEDETLVRGLKRFRATVKASAVWQDVARLEGEGEQPAS